MQLPIIRNRTSARDFRSIQKYLVDFRTCSGLPFPLMRTLKLHSGLQSATRRRLTWIEVELRQESFSVIWELR